MTSRNLVGFVLLCLAAAVVLQGCARQGQESTADWAQDLGQDTADVDRVDSAAPSDADVVRNDADQETGAPTGPVAVISPPSLDFGNVELNSSKTLDLTVFNSGDQDLQILGLGLMQGSNGDLRVDNAPAQAVMIQPGNSIVFKVTFAPTTRFLPTSDAIGALYVTTDWMEVADVHVPIYGSVDGPALRLDPSDKVEFGIVAQGWAIERTVTVTNVGNKPALLSNVEIATNTFDNEFAVVPGTAENEEFAGPMTLEANQSVVVRLSFTNNTSASGTAIGSAQFHSDGPLTQPVSLALIASRGGLPECKLAFVPGKLEFGCVAHGESKTQTLYVKNVGSGYCKVESGLIQDWLQRHGTHDSVHRNRCPPQACSKLSAPPNPCSMK